MRPDASVEHGAVYILIVFAYVLTLPCNRPYAVYSLLSRIIRPNSDVASHYRSGSPLTLDFGLV